jgi:hypothetical protein
VYRSYSTEPKTITIWTIPTGDGVRIALLIVALPVYVLGMILAVAGAVAIVLHKRGRLVLPIAAAVLLLLGALFFMMGISQLADLVGYPDDLSFLSGFYIMLAGFIPALVAGALVGYERFRYGDEEDEGQEDQALAPPSAENDITDDDTVREEDVE